MWQDEKKYRVMKLNKSYIFGIFIIVMMSFGIPTFLWVRDFVIGGSPKVDSNIASQYATVINTVIAFWSMMLNVVLVVIAFRAFKNFDVKKQYHNGQLEVMTKLVNEMVDFNYGAMFCRPSISPSGDKHIIKEGYIYNFFQHVLGFNYDSVESLYGRSRNIENIFPFLRYRNHPMIPVHIAKKLHTLYRPFHYQRAVLEKDMSDNRVMLSSETVSKDELLHDAYYEITDDAKTYIKECIELRLAIKSWFEKYGADDINI
ncbi:TPA: hypothetical protein NJ057_004705 [Vibrio parahaemolyticus]|nr:hypothetical protein [Vibrio parahaemolyticus]HCG8032881.1 hypothetical protein [Vibrio parahaemolyticus]HCG8053693.1 hypothetical protein [Vibrio parahaemolyticus]HCG8069201.1 hypothetical protein [Vibrio parahaemolyticus]HCG9001417.1 hypothetical protein [Vibrio parahaemolyticus]